MIFIFCFLTMAISIFQLLGLIIVTLTFLLSLVFGYLGPVTLLLSGCFSIGFLSTTLYFGIVRSSS